MKYEESVTISSPVSVIVAKNHLCLKTLSPKCKSLPHFQLGMGVEVSGMCIPEERSYLTLKVFAGSQALSQYGGEDQLD